MKRWTRLVAVIAGLVAAGSFLADPGDFSLAYRFVVFALLAPAIGCLVFSLIHRLTGGQWATGLRPFLRAGVSLLPWIWVCALPILFLPPTLGRNMPRLFSAPNGYESRAMVTLRALIYAAVFFGLSRAVAEDAGPDDSPTPSRRPWVGPVGMLVMIFTLTLLADDWIASLEAGWHSTGFSLVWITGQAVAGLSLALVGALAGGAQPVANGRMGRPLGIDWGNLMMAALLVWCYVAFAQFLIIWAGNLPAEISWFQHRAERPWKWVPPLLAVFGFLVPFLLLLSRRYKASAEGLVVVALMLLLSQGLYTAWLILPAAGHLSLAGCLLVLALLAAGGAVFANRYWAAAQRLGRPTA
jgi:hypothetical protein